MKIKDKEIKKWVDVSDKDCPYRPCYWPRLYPGTFTPGVGYQHRNEDWVCGTREKYDCPIPKPEALPKEEGDEKTRK